MNIQPQHVGPSAVGVGEGGLRVSLAPVTPPLAPSLLSPDGESGLTNKPSIATPGRGRRRRTRGNERTNTIGRHARDTRVMKIRKIARFEGLALGLNYATRDLRVNRSAVLFYRPPRMFSSSRARSTPPPVDRLRSSLAVVVSRPRCNSALALSVCTPSFSTSWSSRSSNRIRRCGLRLLL